MTRRSRSFVLVSAALLGALVSGCSGSRSSSAPTTGGSSATEVPTSAGVGPEPTTSGSVVPDTVPSSGDTTTSISTADRPTVISTAVAPGTGSGFVGARADATLSTCVGSSGSWSASGTVRNPTTGTVDYRIYVAFLDGSGATLGLLEVDVNRVRADQSATWSGALTLSAESLHCLLRVERTDR